MRTLVAARRSRTLLLLRYILGETGEDVPTRRAFDLLAEVRRTAPSAVEATLDHPLVSAWATRTATSIREGRPGGTAWLGRVALAAAIRGRVDADLSVPGDPAGFHLPSLGMVTYQFGAAVTVRCGDNSTSISDLVRVPLNWRQPAPGWCPTPAVEVRGSGLRTTFLLEHWPREYLPVGLHAADQIDESQWRTLVSSSWDLLTRWHRESAEELGAAISVLAPLRTVSGGTTSATLDDAFGAVFLSPAPTIPATAVTLVHELQHAKLTALMDMFTLVRPVAGEVFYAPWRDDPRPLAGLLHGTYAFSGVAAFWRRQRLVPASMADVEHAAVEFARWRTAATTAADTIFSSNRLTPLGETFMTTLATTLDSWHDERVPKAAQRQADRLLTEHRAKWQTANISRGISGG